MVVCDSKTGAPLRHGPPPLRRNGPAQRVVQRHSPRQRASDSLLVVPAGLPLSPVASVSPSSSAASSVGSPVASPVGSPVASPSARSPSPPARLSIARSSPRAASPMEVAPEHSSTPRSSLSFGRASSSVSLDERLQVQLCVTRTKGPVRELQWTLEANVTEAFVSVDAQDALPWQFVHKYELLAGLSSSLLTLSGSQLLTHMSKVGLLDKWYRLPLVRVDLARSYTVRITTASNAPRLALCTR